MSTGGDVSDQLSRLKTRSGRSYEWIARRTHTSKSSVQRYCAGTATPPVFGVVERIALACGASAEEVGCLFRAWDRERTADSVPPPAPVPPEEARSEAAAVPRRRAWANTAFVTVVLVVVAVLVVRNGPAGEKPSGESTGGSRPAVTVEPSWKRGAMAVPASFFGVTINSSTGAMPGIRVGAVRLWDSQTRWAQLEPSRGTYDWTVLDRLVDGAGKAGLPVLFTFGGTPRWANPEAPAAAYPDGSRAAPPTDLTDWEEIVRSVSRRYAGRIEAYEVWPLGNDPRFFNGGVGTLVDMTRRASRILRAADPGVTVVCPGMGNLWTTEGQAVLRRFAEAGGYDHCDVASVKLYQRRPGDAPETMLDLVATIDQLMHASGVQPRLWVTGTTFGISEQAPLPAELLRAHATRYYLTGLYGKALNIERMYYYNWGGSRIPLVLQAEGLPPTPAGQAVDRLQEWLDGASVTSCQRGATARRGSTWQCRVEFSKPRQRAATVRWTDTGTVDVEAGPRDVAVRDLDDRVTPVRPGDRITVSPEPVLVEQNG